MERVDWEVLRSGGGRLDGRMLKKKITVMYMYTTKDTVKPHKYQILNMITSQIWFHT